MTLISSEWKKMLKSHLGLWMKNTLLVAFLFVVLHIFLGVGMYMDTLSQQVQNKLGVYLYLNDVPGKETQVYNQVIRMKKDLEQHGATINFVSKDDALAFLWKKMPNLTENFEKFNIENPLQSTLYITFSDIESYKYVKEVIEQHKTIIDNYKDIEKGTSLHSQNNRVLGVMHLSKFIKILFYGMVLLFAILIFALLKHFLKNIAHYFHHDMYRKKIMGATVSQIISPLLMYTIVSLFVGILLAGIATIGLGFGLNYYIFANFWINSLSYIFSSTFALALGVEVSLVFILSSVIAYRYLQKVNTTLK